MSAVATPAFAHKLPRVKYFRAWNLAGGLKSVIEARPVEVSADDLADACAQASEGARHKDSLFVQEVDEARKVNIVHVYRVRQGQAVWRKNPQTGLSERQHPLKAEHQFSLPVAAFEPAAPFDAFRDDPTGVDRTMVEALS